MDREALGRLLLQSVIHAEGEDIAVTDEIWAEDSLERERFMRAAEHFVAALDERRAATPC